MVIKNVVQFMQAHHDDGDGHHSSGADSQRPQEVFGWVWLALFIFVDLVVWILFWRNRNHEALKKKKPRLISAQNVIIIIWTLMACMRLTYSQTFPCLLEVWVLIVPIVFVYALNILRGLILYFNFIRAERVLRYLPHMDKIANRAERGGSMSMTVDSVELSLSATSSEESDSSIKFHQRLKLVDPRHVTILLFLFTFVMMVPIIVASIEGEIVEAFSNEHCHFGWIQPIFSAYLGICAFMLLVVSFLLRSFGEENTNTKRELQYLSTGTVVFAIPYWILNESYHEIDDEIFPFSFVLLLILMQLFYLVPTVPPLISCWRNRQINVRQQAKTFKEDLTFEKVLESSAGLKAFQDFLQTEFAVENLLFHNEFVRYHKDNIANGAWKYAFPDKESQYVSMETETAQNGFTSDDGKDNSGTIKEFEARTLGRINRRARHIYFAYFSANSVTELNISAQITDEVKTTLKIVRVNESELYLGPLARGYKRKKVNRKQTLRHLLRVSKTTRRRAGSASSKRSSSKRSSSKKSRSRGVTQKSGTETASEGQTEDSRTFETIDEKSEDNLPKKSPQVPLHSFGENGIDVERVKSILCVFDEAHNHVLRNLRADNFPRFKNSVFCLRLILEHGSDLGIVMKHNRSAVERIMTSEVQMHDV